MEQQLWLARWLFFLSFLYWKGGGEGGSKKSLCRIWHRKRTGYSKEPSMQCEQTLSLETCPVCRSRRWGSRRWRPRWSRPSPPCESWSRWPRGPWLPRWQVMTKEIKLTNMGRMTRMFKEFMNSITVMMDKQRWPCWRGFGKEVRLLRLGSQRAGWLVRMARSEAFYLI